ncbi:hypothetical protein Z969_10050 [Clostridium novyi A str. 4570]|uniref:Uncharacterized protein n=1 Tax=Clostridium novyi A str. 4570 TaxID=1444290 RepID=A0AA88ZRM9_CLONO|nr:hypothetical protein [Clostridium novyi]KGN00182.1 hypothetical protein Z969_10050 [Clostridium novyi A str. 4570]
MAVIFAVVGGGAVVGIATSDPYSDYSEYNDYSDYDNYSNYSDAAERRKRRFDEKTREINNKKYKINSYKTNKVNEYLHSNSLKQQSGVSVSVSEVKKDGNTGIQNCENMKFIEESRRDQVAIDEIDEIINKIDKILQEDE